MFVIPCFAIFTCNSRKYINPIPERGGGRLTPSSGFLYIIKKITCKNSKTKTFSNISLNAEKRPTGIGLRVSNIPNIFNLVFMRLITCSHVIIK